jgi:hypothetical protein
MRTVWNPAIAIGVLLATTAVVHAQNSTATSNGTSSGAINKLEDFKSTGAKTIPLLPQDPQKAADIAKSPTLNSSATSHSSDE